MRRERDQKTEEEARKERNEDQEFVLVMWTVNDHHRAMAQIAADLADLRQALIGAHADAVLLEAAAREALEEARRHAVVLADGRRVYFTADGSALYGEDGKRIIDETTIEEARQRRSVASTTHEEFVERSKIREKATETAKQLAGALAELDQIESELVTGDPDPARLQELRDGTDRIVAALPEDVRERYDRLRAARLSEDGLAYRPADPAFEPATVLVSEFRRAASAVATAGRPSPNGQSKAFAYRATDF